MQKYISSVSGRKAVSHLGGTFFCSVCTYLHLNSYVISRPIVLPRVFVLKIELGLQTDTPCFYTEITGYECKLLYIRLNCYFLN